MGRSKLWGIELDQNIWGEICLALSGLTDEEAKTPAKHYHVEEFMNDAEPGSVPTLITLNLGLEFPISFHASCEFRPVRGPLITMGIKIFRKYSLKLFRPEALNWGYCLHLFSLRPF